MKYIEEELDPKGRHNRRRDFEQMDQGIDYNNRRNKVEFAKQSRREAKLAKKQRKAS